MGRGEEGDPEKTDGEREGEGRREEEKSLSLGPA